MKKWCIYILAFLWVTACTSERFIGDDDPKPPIENGNPAMKLHIVFPDMGSGSFSKAISILEENEIDTLDIFVFLDETEGMAASMNDKYLYRVSLPKDSIREVVSASYTHTASLELKTIPEKGQRLVCVANIPPGLNLSLTEEVSTEYDLVRQLKFSGTPWYVTPTSLNHTGIPMWGRMSGTMTFDPPNAPAPLNPLISMVRSMAKIEVGVDVNGTGDPALGFGYIFKLDSVYVCHASDSGYIAPHDNYIDQSVVYKTNPVNAKQRVNRIGFKFEEYPSGSRTLGNTVYVPETDSFQIMTSPVDTIKPAFLVIKAQYYNGAAGGYNDYYYRIDFTKGDEYKPLLRNHSYLVNILNIRMPGYTTLDSAMAAPLTSTNYAVNVDEGGGPNVSPEIMDISVYKNQYMLGVNTSEVLFDWIKEEWIGRKSTETIYYPLIMYTDYEGGWSASVTEGSAWLDIRYGAGSFSDAAGGGKTPPPAINLDILVTSDNLTGEEREGEITLTAGLLTKKIRVRQSGGANTVVVRSGQTVRIPLAFAAKARAALGLPAVTGTSAQSGFWSLGMSAPSLTATEINGTVTFSLDRNGIILLKDGSGNIIWSWFVWAIDDDYSPAFHSMNTTSVWMKKLLGGPNWKTYYQWGRKDPFQDPITYGTAPASSTGMVELSVLHPDTFYTSSSFPYNWAGDYMNNNLWYGIDGKKTYNDPCPSGWRVPYYLTASQSPWQNETSAGLAIFQNTGYISAAGVFTDSPSPGPGYIWAASTVSYQAYYASISSTTPPVLLNPLATAYRGNGYRVRCVKDISRKY